ncbi:M23 family metallopeptidase [Pseudoclavibacter sp. RFBG4]|uniref:M23 family metallopeptidase n=1 Tax=Pseudoclavibacter sp. RFBG4 TaxID=2080575 RepID=UPI0015E37C51|nr:M23 family metallopeptidase [Pseudoclavibacter sp. RFBG4]
MKFEWPFNPADVIVPPRGEFGPRLPLGAPEGLPGAASDLEQHDGIDLNAPAGAIVRAAAAGVVTLLRVDGEDDEGEGNAVWLRHSEAFQTRYLHLDSVLVEHDQVVELGQPIGTVGQTGNAPAPHLCFLTLVAGRAFNPRTFMRDRAREETTRD